MMERNEHAVTIWGMEGPTSKPEKIVRIPKEIALNDESLVLQAITDCIGAVMVKVNERRSANG